MSTQCQAATFKMENACESAVEPEDPGQPSTATEHAEERSRPAGQRLGEPEFLLHLLVGSLGSVCGGIAGGAGGLVGAACAATYSMVTENISTLDVATGFFGSVVGGTVGGLFCGAVGGTAGAVAARRFERSGSFRLAFDVALATLGGATGGAIGCNFHRTVGTIGGATGAAFGALLAREFATDLTVTFLDYYKKKFATDAGSELKA